MHLKPVHCTIAFVFAIFGSPFLFSPANPEIFGKMTAAPDRPWLRWILIATAVLIAIARPFMPTHPASLPGSYEAAAHLFVGGVIGAWIATRQRWLLVIAIGVSVVEVVCRRAGSLVEMTGPISELPPETQRLPTTAPMAVCHLCVAVYELPTAQD